MCIRDSHVAVPIEHLQQQLSAKEVECRQKDEVIIESSKVMSLKDEAFKQKDVVMHEIR